MNYIHFLFISKNADSHMYVFVDIIKNMYIIYEYV
jgi:hypothetical protein